MQLHLSPGVSIGRVLLSALVKVVYWIFMSFRGCHYQGSQANNLHAYPILLPDFPTCLENCQVIFLAGLIELYSQPSAKVYFQTHLLI